MNSRAEIAKTTTMLREAQKKIDKYSRAGFEVGENKDLDAAITAAKNLRSDLNSMLHNVQDLKKSKSKLGARKSAI